MSLVHRRATIFLGLSETPSTFGLELVDSLHDLHHTGLVVDNL